MFSEKLKQLNLHEIIKEDMTENEYEQKMAAALREKVFLYLQGKLLTASKEPLPDGPEVKACRENLAFIGGMDQFMRKQSPQGAWATDIELTLLAELLDTNFIVETPETLAHGVPMILNANPDVNKPNVVLLNTDNLHWDAIINGKKVKALEDGNCGYNSFALSIKELVAPVSQLSGDFKETVIHTQKQEEKRYKLSIRELKKSEEQFDNMMNFLRKTDSIKYEKVQNQIEQDAQLAFKFAMEDLPDITGKMDNRYLNSINKLCQSKNNMVDENSKNSGHNKNQASPHSEKINDTNQIAYSNASRLGSAGLFTAGEVEVLGSSHFTIMNGCSNR